MSLEFLAADGAEAYEGSVPLARSPIEHDAAQAGATFEARDGWNIPVSYAGAGAEQAAARDSVVWADSSQLGKIEIQAGRDDLAAIVAAASGVAALEAGMAARARSAWWCPVTHEKVIVLADASATAELRDAIESAAGSASGTASVVEVTTVLGAMTIAGPQARETFARFCALDLRPAATPFGGFRPGSVARTPGYVLREGEDRFLMIFGWAVGHYVWTVVADAAGHLGGAPAALDSLGAIEAAEEVPASA